MVRNTPDNVPSGATIIRATRAPERFTKLSNDVLRDSRLSYRARGVLAAILSRPDNWRTNAVQLAREGREGRDAVITALNELEVAGYVIRRRWRDERGRFGHTLTVFETPQVATDDTGRPGTSAAEPQVSDVRAGQPKPWKSGAGRPAPDSQASYEVPRRTTETNPDGAPLGPDRGRFPVAATPPGKAAAARFAARASVAGWDRDAYAPYLGLIGLAATTSTADPDDAVRQLLQDLDEFGGLDHTLVADAFELAGVELGDAYATRRSVA